MNTHVDAAVVQTSPKLFSLFFGLVSPCFFSVMPCPNLKLL
jgi:hypothetical protein